MAKATVGVQQKFREPTQSELTRAKKLADDARFFEQTAREWENAKGVDETERATRVAGLTAQAKRARKESEQLREPKPL